MNYTFPIFKFAESKFSKEFIDKGQIKIGTLYDYRNEEKYSGKICDNKEGNKTISVRIENVSTKGNEFLKHGIPMGGDGNIKLSNSTITLDLNSKNCYIYCTASELLSDTLIQYFEEDGYDSCVMITQPNEFFKELDKSFEFGTFINFFSCLYGSRNINLNWEQDKEYIKVLKSFPASILKPKEYFHQREIRAILSPNTDSIKPEIIEIPSLTKYLIDINFDDFDLGVLKGKKTNNRIGVRIKMNDGKPDALFSIKYPNEMFSPIIYGIDESLLGFKFGTKAETYKEANIDNAQIGITPTEIGTIFCSNNLNRISRLEYFTTSE